MNIGVINQKSIRIKNGEGTKEHKFLEMSIRPPFMESATFTVSPNKKKDNDIKPDFIIYYSFNRKGENYRRAEVGGIWNKISDNGLEYKSGSIESPIFPSGTLYFSVFKTKIFDGENPENITWSHDVVWTPFKPNEEQSRNNRETNEYQNYNNIEVDESQIPF